MPWEWRGVPNPAPGHQGGLLPEVGQGHSMCKGREPGTEALRGGHGMVGTPGCLQRAEAHDAKKVRSDELGRAGPVLILSDKRTYGPSSVCQAERLPLDGSSQVLQKS